VAFTSAAQVRRIYDVAQVRQRHEAVLQALGAITIAAVGPVVAAELDAHGLRATVVPRESYFMKPLVTALSASLAQR